MKHVMGKQTGHDLGYFVRVGSPLAPASSSLAGGTGNVVRSQAAVLPLADGGAKRAHQILSVLFALSGVLAGAAVAGVITLLSVFGSMWGTSMSGDGSFAIGAWVVVSVLGIAYAIITYLPWRKPIALYVAGEAATLVYPGFRSPLVIPRELVRVVAIDDQPVKPFHDNKRFPVAGLLPTDVFSDALDQYPRQPWEPLESKDPRGTTGPTVPRDHRPQGVPSSEQATERGYLFSADGRSLYVLGIGPADVPNVAVLFHERMKTPRVPMGVALLGHFASGVFPGGRRIRGMMLRFKSASSVGEAFAGWGVVRSVTADDVVEEGLRVGKPLRGWRIAAYAFAVIGPLIARYLMKHLN